MCFFGAHGNVTHILLLLFYRIFRSLTNNGYDTANIRNSFVIAYLLEQISPVISGWPNPDFDIRTQFHYSLDTYSCSGYPIHVLWVIIQTTLETSLDLTRLVSRRRSVGRSKHCPNDLESLRIGVWWGERMMIPTQPSATIKPTECKYLQFRIPRGSSVDDAAGWLGGTRGRTCAVDTLSLHVAIAIRAIFTPRPNRPSKCAINFSWTTVIRLWWLVGWLDRWLSASHYVDNGGAKCRSKEDISIRRIQKPVASLPGSYLLWGL